MSNNLERLQRLSGITDESLLVEYKNGGMIDYVTLVINPTSKHSTKEDCVATFTPKQLIDWAVGAAASGDINNLEPALYYGRAKGAANKDCKARMEKHQAAMAEEEEQASASGVNTTSSEQTQPCGKCGKENCECGCEKCGEATCTCPQVSEIEDEETVALDQEESPKSEYTKGDYVETALGKGVIKKIDEPSENNRDPKFHIKMDKDCEDCKEHDVAGEIHVFTSINGHVIDDKGRRLVVKENVTVVEAEIGTENGRLGNAADAKIEYAEDAEIDREDGSVSPEVKEIKCPTDVKEDMAGCKKDCQLRIKMNDDKGDKALANFYRKVSDCIDYLSDTFEDGSRHKYDLAVTEYHSWMSPIQNALPLSLRKFLTYGAKTNRSLKDYFDETKS